MSVQPAVLAEDAQRGAIVDVGARTEGLNQRFVTGQVRQHPQLLFGVISKKELTVCLVLALPAAVLYRTVLVPTLASSISALAAPVRFSRTEAGARIALGGAEPDSPAALGDDADVAALASRSEALCERRPLYPGFRGYADATLEG